MQTVQRCSVSAMTPVRTFMLALICARAFTYDIGNRNVHNCTINSTSDDENSYVCNLTRLNNNEDIANLTAGDNNSYKLKIKINHSRIQDDFFAYLDDDHEGLYHLSIKKYKNDINTTNNINNVEGNHNWTDNRRYFFGHDPQKLVVDGVFSSNDNFQAYYLAASDETMNKNIRQAFIETLLSDVSDNDVIMELTDEQYYAMPRLFELDDYPSCVGTRGTYCLGSFELSPIGKNQLFSIMQRFSANWVDNFNHTRLHRGVCLSRRCASPPSHVHDLGTWLESCVNASTVSGYNLTASLYHLDYCTKGKEPSPSFSTSEKGFAVLVALLITFTVISTILDTMLSVESKKDYGWALSWSLTYSWRRLTAPAQLSGATDLRVFDGLRVLCMLSVIVEHVCWLGTQVYIGDTRYVELNRRSEDAMLLANSTIMVQIFFLMASFLLAHKLLEEQKRGSSVLTFFKMMFNRIIRVSPSYFIVVWFATTWWERLGDGPQWRSLVRSEANICRQKWWTQFLYVSNLVNTDEKCLIQTWYLAADMQLYALALALTLALRGRRGSPGGAPGDSPAEGARGALPVLGALCAATLAGNFAVAYVLRIVPTIIVHNPELIRASYKGEASFDWMYTSPQSNAAGTLAGLLLAHLHCSGVGRRLAQRRVFRIVSVCAAPAAALLLVLLGPLGTVSVGDPGGAPRLYAAALAAAERPAFAALVAVALLGALNGVKSPWARWLSLGAPLARLSFGALLLHMLLIKSFLASRFAPPHLDRQIVYIEWFGVSALSYLAATPLALLVELPAQRLHKEIISLLQRRFDRNKIKIEEKTIDLVK
ncbi:unnamed protein product, partial [Brenthis ino]